MAEKRKEHKSARDAGAAAGEGSLLDQRAGAAAGEGSLLDQNAGGAAGEGSLLDQIVDKGKPPRDKK